MIYPRILCCEDLPAFAALVGGKGGEEGVGDCMCKKIVMLQCSYFLELFETIRAGILWYLAGRCVPSGASEASTCEGVVGENLS